jgi:hypothetical protein
MQADVNGSSNNQASLDPGEIFEIRDPQIDVEALMRTLRENVARRRAEGAYTEDLDAIADEVFRGVLSTSTISALPSDNEADPASTLAQLNARWAVHEVPFVSRTPVLGPLVVAVRNFWNWMSTKWYVRAILQQQVGFNAAVVRALSESTAAHQALAAETRQLQAICQQQQEEITLLREEVQHLQKDGPRGQV